MQFPHDFFSLFFFSPLTLSILEQIFVRGSLFLVLLFSPPPRVVERRGRSVIISPCSTGFPTFGPSVACFVAMFIWVSVPKNLSQARCSLPFSPVRFFHFRLSQWPRWLRSTKLIHLMASAFSLFSPFCALDRVWSFLPKLWVCPNSSFTFFSKSVNILPPYSNNSWVGPSSAGAWFSLDLTRSVSAEDPLDSFSTFMSLGGRSSVKSSNFGPACVLYSFLPSRVRINITHASLARPRGRHLQECLSSPSTILFFKSDA